MRIAGAPAFGCTGNTVIAPKAAASARSTSARPSGPPDQRERAARTQQPRRGPDPACEHVTRGDMREAAPRIGRARCRAGSLNGGFIITAHDRLRRAARPPRTRAPAPRHRAPRRARAQQARCVGAFSAASAASCGSISTSVTLAPATRVASARPAAPTPAPRSTTCSPARAGVAAASRIASWPKRWPRFGLRKPQPAAQHGVLGQVGRARLTCHRGAARARARRLSAAGAHRPRCVVGHHDAARQHADRAFEHAHVLIEHQCAECRRRRAAPAIAEISTASLVRTSSRKQRLLQGCRRSASSPGARCAEIGQQLHLAPAARDGVEHEAGDRPTARPAASIRSTESAVGRRGTSAVLEIGHEDRDGEADRHQRRARCRCPKRTRAAARSDRD